MHLEIRDEEGESMLEKQTCPLRNNAQDKWGRLGNTQMYKLLKKRHSFSPPICEPHQAEKKPCPGGWQATKEMQVRHKLGSWRVKLASVSEVHDKNRSVLATTPFHCGNSQASTSNILTIFTMTPQTQARFLEAGHTHVLILNEVCAHCIKCNGLSVHIYPGKNKVDVKPYDTGLDPVCLTTLSSSRSVST
jgi:hypothetical protein